MGKTGSREEKRARFVARKARKKGAGGLLSGKAVLVGAIGLLVVGGAIILVLTRLPSQAAGAPAAVPPPPGSSGQSAAAVAATYGHDPYPLVEAQDGKIRLPLSTFDDYQARFYTYMYKGRPIEFFVVKSRDGVVRAAFNACDVCYPARKGYHQEGDVMVCNNCGRRFPTNRINIEQGGCNPAPLNRAVEGDTLIIRVQDLLAGLAYF